MFYYTGNAGGLEVEREKRESRAARMKVSGSSHYLLTFIMELIILSSYAYLTCVV